MSGDRSKRQTMSKASTDDEQAGERSVFFIPSDGIHLDVLALYFHQFIDPGARFTPSTVDESRSGWQVASEERVTQEDVEAMVEDTKSWVKEQERTSNLLFAQSNTARDRLRKGRASQSETGTQIFVQPLASSADFRPTSTQTMSTQSGLAADRAAQRLTSGLSATSVEQQYPPSNVAASHQAQRLTQVDEQPPVLPPILSARPYRGVFSNDPWQTSASQQPVFDVDRETYETLPPLPSDNGAEEPDGNPPTTQPSTCGTHGFSYTSTAGGPPGPPGPRRYGP